MALQPDGPTEVPAPAWDGEAGATCDVSAEGRNLSVLLNATVGVDLAACVSRCKNDLRCNAISHKANECNTFSSCLYMTPYSSSTDVYLKPQLEWPVPKAQVRWRANSVLVVASYNRPLDFLSSTDPSVVDVAVYQKRGQPPEYATQYATNIRYFTHMPNVGINGGSRETAVYLKYILDFYDNLPPVVIFSQDEPGEGSWRTWLDGPKPHLKEVTATSDLASRFGAFTKEACMCKWTTETFYQPHLYGWFDMMNWYNMNFLGNDWYRDSNTTKIGFPKTEVHWPNAAFFATTREAIRRRSTNLYQTSLTLLRVEFKHRGWKTLEWANAFEVCARSNQDSNWLRHRACDGAEAVVPYLRSGTL
jgi:hypothetical protein